jgi:hypothetical protein
MLVYNRGVSTIQNGGPLDSRKTETWQERRENSLQSVLVSKYFYHVVLCIVDSYHCSCLFVHIVKAQEILNQNEQIAIN